MLPVLCFGIFWEGAGADSNYCEVSFDLIIFLLFLEALSAVLIVCFYIVALLLLIIDETFSYCALSSGENWN